MKMAKKKKQKKAVKRQAKAKKAKKKPIEKKKEAKKEFAAEFEPKIKQTHWDPRFEGALFNQWQKQRLFKFDPNIRKPLFAIDTPPPYVNTPVHMGHAYTYVWMDMFARFRRMVGSNVLFPMGLDKNGLPIEVQTEKEFKISMRDVPRQDFINKCRHVLKKSGDASLDSFKKLGLSCNSWKLERRLGGRYDTDDAEYRRLTQETFIALWKKGLVYEDVKPTNYCPVCRTTISDAEVEYTESKAKLSYIKFYIKGTGDFVTIATTRPELLCTCKLIIYHPDDERYKHLQGSTAIVPIYRTEVAIMPHPYAKPEFGTGLVMICSFGDYGDVRLLRELDINPTYAIGPDGRMNKNSGKYAGMTVEQAREQIVADLQALGSIERQLETKQRQPVCWRSKNPVEFVPMKELYLKQVEFRDDILKIADQMKFFAPESKQILRDWVNAINIDWVISRRRYYGTEIPLWYCNDCNYVIVPKPGEYYQPWRDPCPVRKCPKCNGSNFRGEERTFDTWFDSSNSEIYILGYLWNKEFFKRMFPCTLRPQGKEIVRTWFYFSLLKGFLLFSKPAFKEAWIHMHVVDEQGEKMSKSLGNIIDPHEVLKRYGAEAFRIWTVLEGDITKGDIRCSFERISGTAKFLTKLWNIAKFISAFPKPEKRNVVLQPVDRWMLAETSSLAKTINRMYMNYEFSDAAVAIRDFVWNVFASHYIELVKARAYGLTADKKDQKSAWYTLHECLQTYLKLLSPIIPFITDYIWQQLYSSKSIHAEKYPDAVWTSNLTKLTSKLIEFNSLVWNKKKEMKLSLKDAVAVRVPKQLAAFENDLVVMHNIDPKSEHVIRLIEKEKKEEKKEIEPVKPEVKKEKKVAAKPKKEKAKEKKKVAKKVKRKRRL